MINYTTNSLFDSSAQCIVNPVNIVGVMGAGLALEFKKKYPDMFAIYKKMCEKGDLKIGTLGFWKSKKDNNIPIICLFPTKRHFREMSSLRIIESGLERFVDVSSKLQLSSAAFPKLGCGLGGLNFEYHVKPLMEKFLHNCGLDITIHV